MKYFALLMILSGICFLGFGSYQYFYGKHEQSKSLAEAVRLIRHEEKNKNLLKLQNESSRKSPLKDVKIKKGVIGILSIPRIHAALPIIEGTNADDLAKGVGHYTGSALPGEHDQIVLSGHRDTVFRRMGELSIGDVLIIILPYGQYTYKIKNTRIVSASDLTVIHSTSPHETLTVTTCYPFYYVGNAPDRYIVTAYPVAASAK